MKKVLWFAILLISCRNEVPLSENVVSEWIAKKIATLPCLADVSNVTIVDGCGNDPRSYLPMAELYVGSVGMPAAHRVQGEIFSSKVVPRNDQGMPSPTGRIYIHAEGHSNALRVFDAFKGLLSSSSLENSAVRFVNNAAGGMALENWVAAGVGAVDVKVQVVLLHHSLNKTFGNCNQQTYVDSTAFYLRIRLQQLKIKYPNLKQVFLQSREFGGWKCYSSPGAQAEPAGYYNGFGVKTFIASQVSASDSSLNYQNAPFLAWSFNPWDPATLRSWFEEPGLHPCSTGASFWAQQWFDFLLNDSTTKGWFAKQ
jgi:hypothetical protein